MKFSIDLGGITTGSEEKTEANHPVGRVLAIHGEQSLVEVEDRLYRCYLSGRLKHKRREAQPAARTGEHWRRDNREVRGRWVRSREDAPSSSPVAVGDRVHVRIGDERTGMILDRLERDTWLGRLRPTKGPQVIAANVDIALVVMSVAEPAPNFFLLDQFLIQSAAGSLKPWVIFHKIDFLDLPAGAGANYPEAVFYRALGYPVFCTSARTLEGMAELDAALQGRTAVFVGPSGVGKSTLLNHLIPKVEARTTEISEWSGRGQHTTTHVAMYPLPGGGYLVDAPGIRSLALWQVTPEHLSRYFPEFAPYEGECEYPGCAHLNEANCAVREAAEKGDISWRRYRHYKGMRSE